VATSTPTESPEEIITDAVKTACQMKPAASPTVGVSTGVSAIARLCPNVDSSITLPDEWTAKTPGDLLYVVDVQNGGAKSSNPCGPFREVINGKPTGLTFEVNGEIPSVNISLISTQTGQVVDSATVNGTWPSCPQGISSSIPPLMATPLSVQGLQKEIADTEIVDLVSQVNFPTLSTLTGHTGYAVESVAFSPDGKLLAAGSDDNSVILWDVASGKEVNTLNGHGHLRYIRSVAFSPDGKLLASESDNFTVVLWDVASGQAVNTLTGNTSYVDSVAFSPDGKLLASVSDSIVILWDVASGQEVRMLKGTPPGYIESVAFSRDGKLLASASAGAYGQTDSTVILWDVASGKEVNTLARYTSNVDSVALSPDWKLLAAGSMKDNTVILWNVASGQEVRTLKDHTLVDVIRVAFSPDGKLLLAAGSIYPTVTLWDVASGQEVGTLDIGAVSNVAFSADGKLLASVSGNEVTLSEVKLH